MARFKKELSIQDITTHIVTPGYWQAHEPNLVATYKFKSLRKARMFLEFADNRPLPVPLYMKMMYDLLWHKSIHIIVKTPFSRN